MSGLRLRNRCFLVSVMHLIYIDDSYDHTTRTYVFSAIAVPESEWANLFDAIRQWRRELRGSDGIYVTKELHAWKFVTGRGRVAPGMVTKWRRCQIFKEGLQLLAKQPNIRIFNSCRTPQRWAFERLLNRINRTMQEGGSYALLICDEGKEAEYTRLVRKMSVHNPIPSRYGAWRDTGLPYRNIPLDRVLEDPFFKKSDQSYFIQMSDWCAYALLQQERPLPSRMRYGLHKSFVLLAPICVLEANPHDPLGIIR